MTSVAGDAQVDTHLQESYLNDRCAYLTDQLAQHNAQMNARTRSASVSQNDRNRQKHNRAVVSHQRRASAQV